MKRARFAAGAALIMAFGLLASAGAGTKNYGGGSRPCGNNGVITWSPGVLWPPNHKAQTITFTYSDPDAGTKTLTITPNPHNEMVDGEEINGTGNTPAATDSMGGTGSSSDGSVTVQGSAVAERSGHKNADGGRVYEFDYVASNDESGTADDGCTSSPSTAGDGITVFVPHDCRAGACKPQS